MVVEKTMETQGLVIKERSLFVGQEAADRSVDYVLIKEEKIHEKIWIHFISFFVWDDCVCSKYVPV